MKNANVPPVLVESPGQTIRYSLSRWDIIRFQMWAAAHNKVRVGCLLIFAAFLAWITFRTPEMAEHPLAVRILAGTVFVAGLLCAMVLGQFGLVALWVWFRKGRGMFGEHELIIREDGLVERTDVNESLARWSGFHKIVSSGRYLYVFVTDTNVHIVPKRCFPSEEERQSFEQEIEQRMKSAR